jgi:hypothetical protein
MKKLLGSFLGTMIAMGMMITPAFASYNDLYKQMMPGITKAQYDYTANILSQIKPDATKLKQGIFQVYLPKLNSNYRYAIAHGADAVNGINKLGGVTVSFKLSGADDGATIMILNLDAAILNELDYFYNPSTKSLSVNDYDTILKNFKALQDKTDEDWQKELEEIKNPPQLIMGISDIANHWAKDNIQKALQLGFMKGYPDHTFKPDNTITRAEFTTALIQSLKLKPTTNHSVFVDDNNWSEGFIQAAIESGIIKPDEYPNHYYLPDQNITREEMAIMTVRGLKLEQKATNAIEVSKLQTNLTDLSQVEDKWRGYVALANNLGVIKGYEDHTFQPNQTATRAEAVSIILNMLQTTPTS